MNAPCIPSQSLLEGKPYTPADKTDTHGILARWRFERSEDNPANYPDDSECNEVDAAGTFKG